MAFQQAQLGSVSPIGGSSTDALTTQLLLQKLQADNQKKGFFGLGGGSKLDPQALSQLGSLLGNLGQQQPSQKVETQPIGSTTETQDATLNPVQGVGGTATAAAQQAKDEKNGFFAESGEILGGAATGAKLGSAAGPIGTGVGALIGGLLGLFG